MITDPNAAANALLTANATGGDLTGGGPASPVVVQNPLPAPVPVAVENTAMVSAPAGIPNGLLFVGLGIGALLLLTGGEKNKVGKKEKSLLPLLLIGGFAAWWFFFKDKTPGAEPATVTPPGGAAPVPVVPVTATVPPVVTPLTPPAGGGAAPVVPMILGPDSNLVSPVPAAGMQTPGMVQAHYL